MDKTLTDRQIREKAKEGFIKNYDEECINGASYDFRAGDTVIVARPDQSNYLYESLKHSKEIDIRPGYACTFYSLEKVKLPMNFKGRLSLRSYFANKKLLYAGGLIDPGYNGYLFFTLFNLGNSIVKISYKEPIVTGEFTEIDSAEISYCKKGEEILELPEDKLVLFPKPSIKMYDWLEISVMLKKHNKNLQELKITKAIIDLIFFAIIAGVVAGVVILTLQSIIN